MGSCYKRILLFSLGFLFLTPFPFNPASAKSQDLTNTNGNSEGCKIKTYEVNSCHGFNKCSCEVKTYKTTCNKTKKECRDWKKVKECNTVSYSCGKKECHTKWYKDLVFEPYYTTVERCHEESYSCQKTRWGTCFLFGVIPYPCRKDYWGTCTREVCKEERVKKFRFDVVWKPQEECNWVEDTCYREDCNWEKESCQDWRTWEESFSCEKKKQVCERREEVCSYSDISFSKNLNKSQSVGSYLNVSLELQNIFRDYSVSTDDYKADTDMKLTLITPESRKTKRKSLEGKSEDRITERISESFYLDEKLPRGKYKLKLRIEDDIADKIAWNTSEFELDSKCYYSQQQEVEEEKYFQGYNLANGFEKIQKVCEFEDSTLIQEFYKKGTIIVNKTTQEFDEEVSLTGFVLLPEKGSSKLKEEIHNNAPLLSKGVSFFDPGIGGASLIIVIGIAGMIMAKENVNPLQAFLRASRKFDKMSKNFGKGMIYGPQEGKPVTIAGDIALGAIPFGDLRDIAYYHLNKMKVWTKTKISKLTYALSWLGLVLDITFETGIGEAGNAFVASLKTASKSLSDEAAGILMKVVKNLDEVSVKAGKELPESIDEIAAFFEVIWKNADDTVKGIFKNLDDAHAVSKGYLESLAAFFKRVSPEDASKYIDDLTSLYFKLVNKLDEDQAKVLFKFLRKDPELIDDFSENLDELAHGLNKNWIDMHTIEKAATDFDNGIGSLGRINGKFQSIIEDLPSGLKKGADGFNIDLIKRGTRVRGYELETSAYFHDTETIYWVIRDHIGAGTHEFGHHLAYINYDGYRSLGRGAKEIIAEAFAKKVDEVYKISAKIHMSKYQHTKEISEFLKENAEEFGGETSAIAFLKSKARMFGTFEKQIDEFIRGHKSLSMDRVINKVRYYEGKCKKVIMKWEK